MALHVPPGFPAPARFKPQCTHLTMTRLYGFDFVCETCRRPGPFGWVYRCTQDREELIEHEVADGFPACFDDLGEYLSSKLVQRSRSAAARADSLSFFEEVTPEHFSQYHPDQLRTVLRQREHVRQAIANEKFRERMETRSHGVEPDIQSTLFLGTRHLNPWVPNPEHECRYMVCPSCRPRAADRSYLSLNGVAKGEIQPTSAVGYGFHIMGERPVVDADILRSIGCRPALTLDPPVEQDLESKSDLPYHLEPFENTSTESSVSLVELLERQISRSQHLFVNDKLEYIADNGSNIRTELIRVPRDTQGRLKHSPACDNLSMFAQPVGSTLIGGETRSPWTPPPSPSQRGRDTATEMHYLGVAAEKSISNGRSSISLKTNPSARQQMLSSVPSTSARDRIGQFGYLQVGEQVPYLPESEYDVGLTLPFNKSTFDSACQTPLEPPNPAEEIYFGRDGNDSASHEEVSDALTTAQVHVDYGVAMLEESVELGVPDIVAEF